MQSPNTNFDPTEKLTNSKQDKNMGPYYVYFDIKDAAWMLI
jgi:hypothetical protein